MNGEKLCTGGYEELYLLFIESTGYVALKSISHYMTITLCNRKTIFRIGCSFSLDRMVKTMRITRGFRSSPPC